MWARMAADPAYSPEQVARAAVARMGPEAVMWADIMRARYPGAPADRLARLATRRFIRLARRQGAAGAALGAAGVTVGAAGATMGAASAALGRSLGAAGLLAGTGALAHTQARMVLHVAAAYGHDPTADARVHELLSLLQIPRLTEPPRTVARNVRRLVRGYAVHRAARLVPWGAAIAGAWTGARATDRVADRAVEFYRKR